MLSSEFLLGKRRLKGRGMASKREEVVFFFFAMGESVENSDEALQHSGHSEKFLGREVGWKPDGCE